MLFNNANSGYHGVQMLGLMNALKTGDPTKDTLIAMALPIVVTKVINELSRKHGQRPSLWWSRLCFWSKRRYKRTITYKTSSGGGGGGGGANNGATGTNLLDEDSYNCFLIKAIQLYMHKYCKLDLQDVNLELTQTSHFASSSDDTGIAGKQQSMRGHMMMLQRAGGGRGGKTNNLSSNATSTFGMLQNCQIIQKPIHQKWHEIGCFDGAPVHVWISETSSSKESSGSSIISNGGDGSPSTESHSVELRFESQGSTSIDCFVQKAYQWYLSEVKKEENNDRFLYDLKGFDGRGGHRYPIYASYKLGDEKTFQSLFSKQCHDLLTMVDQFQNKTGKYSVAGYPHKLGLLLHGPPGTGKTSLIKALAHYTGRHIFNVPLARIQTNQELMTLFNNHRFVIAGKPKAHLLDFDKLIYVFEDIDGSSDVVMKRDAASKEEQRAAAQDNTHHAGIIERQQWQQRRKGNNPSSFPPFANGPNAVVGGANNNNNNGNNRNTPRILLDEDELNLTGLLNVLDGVVDSPGRIVVMTTNHPEVLDPALIRPGRIDKKLELSYMLPEDAIRMLEHYYQTQLSESEKHRIHVAIGGDTSKDNKPLDLIPARVEQLAMEEETVDAMIQWLEEQRRSVDESLVSACSTTVAEELSSESTMDSSSTSP